MSSSSQPAHPTLLIPGPVEFDDAVLQSMGHPAEAHVAPGFVKIFSESLILLRKLFQTSSKDSQGLVISGSGTLGWDLVAANLIEPGEDALVLHTGYFGDSFAACIDSYGGKATQLKAPVGERPSLEEIESALKEKKYKVLTVTHVDTSTGVISDIEAIAALVRKVSPETLVVVDGVCSVGCENIEFDKWDLDVVLTGSQKAIGVPAGLSVVMMSGRAIDVHANRKAKVSTYYCSLTNWLPIMRNYEANKPSYFATPSTQLIHALHTSLNQITQDLPRRFQQHIEVSDKVKKAVADLGLKQLPTKPENQSHAMTTIVLPEGMTGPDVLPQFVKRNLIFAGGLHKEIASKYIRMGHMHVSVTDPQRDDIDRAIAALKEVFGGK